MSQPPDRMEEEIDNNENIEEIRHDFDSNKTFSDPDIVGILFHEQRGQILKKLIENEKTIRELSLELNLNPGTVKRHIIDLLEHHLITISNKKKSDIGITMIYYRATARNYRIELDFNRDFHPPIKKL